MESTRGKVIGVVILFLLCILFIVGKKSKVKDFPVSIFFLFGMGSLKAFKLVIVHELTIVDYYINDFSVVNKEDESYELFKKVTIC
ncbi:hypothetical protein [Bacillus sp. FSL R10-2780]|uniref:hypothetical protein n=1 Tax=Bacillus sp. FSL R10-2780 TaxID=2954660 RepID=UPI0030F5CE4E